MNESTDNYVDNSDNSTNNVTDYELTSPLTVVKINKLAKKGRNAQFKQLASKMHMTFWWDYKIDNFLFPGLNISSVSAFVALCLVVGLFSFLFELLRYFQAKHRQRELILRSRQLRTICTNESSSLLSRPALDPLEITLCTRSLLHGTEISLWFFLHNLGYLLMLCVMIYNGWLFLSAVLGGGLGYFIFGQLFMKINLENCQIIRETFCKMQNCGEMQEKDACTKDGESTPALEALSDLSSSSRNAHHSCHNHKILVSVDVECDRNEI